MPRISVCGTASVGKSQVVKDFLTTWPLYTTPKESYRDILKEKKLKHSSKTCEETQQLILDFMVNQEKQYRKGDKIIFDRCSLDCLVYTLHGHEKGKISKEFVDKMIARVRDSLTHIDIIFFIPITGISKFKIDNTNNALRDTNELYAHEIDNIFKALCAEYQKHNTPFFFHDDKPALIEIFGTPQERIEIMKLYLDKDGDNIGEGAIINPYEIEKAARQLGVRPGDDLVKTVLGQLRNKV